MSCVKLAIRVRPFTEKELRSEKERVPVVSVVDDNTVAITNIKVSLSGAGDSRERVRHYHADYTFDSSCPLQQQSYASQEKVFEAIGSDVIKSVSRGCSACVLAYGQSATGKTHTMMGTEAQPGLIPRLCKALFDVKPFELTVSFLEIYNERVHDLLVGEAVVPCHSLPRRRGNARKDLRVREHPTRGPYVQNLRRVSVNDAEALLALVGEGARRRRTAATRRNPTSSRSHALIEIATPHAILHLADLAGSEKASWEGCGGGRQKEGANINKSLVALSNVISALVNGGAGRGRFVPYRDSALTWLLKDCFTGGARAFIIATVSPSFACYGESASTLRWAARARQLPIPRIVNGGTVSRAALQAQLNQLIAELTRNHIRYIPATGEIAFEDQHWTLLGKIETLKNCNLETTKEIGNIMSQTHPKPDANNSESTASSVASVSSDVVNAMERNYKITNEINKEIDKFFGPALERTSSGVDLKIVAPLRHRRRQCRSQEVLTLDETMNSQNNSLLNTLPIQSEIQIQDIQKTRAPPVTILHENQRADIVASVTERLYSRLKKKEQLAASKVESIVDKNIVQPLSELRICTNARQRLMELSQKALRNKRRIGIPAHTQTKITVTRVKDQAIDVQTDLLTYVVQNKLYTLQRDAATETIPMTPRCKEIAAGPTSSIHYRDGSTETQKILRKNSLMMTDVVSTLDCCTQTPIVPPPRRRRRQNLLKNNTCQEHRGPEELSSVPVININISQTYPVDTESQSSDDNTENREMNNKSGLASTTPDLLTNHSSVELKTHDDQTNTLNVSVNVTDTLDNPSIEQNSTESVNDVDQFSDTDDQMLPRVTVNSSKKPNPFEIKDIIMGRNDNMYPYNIVLSPPRERDNSKRIVKFKDTDGAPAMSVASQTSWEWEHNNTLKSKLNYDTDATGKDFELYNNHDHESEYVHSDSTESSKMETNSFIWKKDRTSKTLGYPRRNYVPVYKSSKYKTTKQTFYKESIGVEGDLENKNKYYQKCISPDSLKEISSSDIQRDYITKHPLRRQKLYPRDIVYTRNESKNVKQDHLENFERKIFNSCNNLDDSVNKYENYLISNRAGVDADIVEYISRRPKDYLQHLVKLRREAVRAENDASITDSSIDTSNE